MATNAVKFYAVKEMPTENVNASGIYFVAGTDGMPGRIYKGNTLFGAAIITKESSASNVQNPVRGDINIGDAGAQIYNGTEWLSLSANQTQIEKLIKENINTNLGAIIGYEPTKLTDAEKTAEGVEFREGDGYYKVEGEGDEKTETQIGDKDGNKLDAEGNVIPSDKSYVNVDTATFKNLTVSDTATFTATSISAESLNVSGEATFGEDGKTISEIADAQIAAITVTEIPEDESANDKLATVEAIKSYVEDAVSNAEGDVDDIKDSLYGEGETPDELDTSDGVLKDATSVVDAINKTADAIDTLNGDADTEGSVANTVKTEVDNAIGALTGEDGVSGSYTVDGETEATATVTIKSGEDGALAPEIDINEATVIRESEGDDVADDAHLATEKAVRDAIDAALANMTMNWYGFDEEGNEVELT